MFDPEQRKDFKRAMGLSAHGLELGLWAALAMYAGPWLEARYGHAPWLGRGLNVVAVVGGLRSFVRLYAEAKRLMGES